MIIDKIENLRFYGVISREYEEQILSFIQRVKMENLGDGKYQLEKDALFALVQSYETREENKNKMEAHKKYIDLQYIISGSEKMYCDIADDLAIIEKYTEDSDILFMKKEKEKVSILLEEGMFAFLFPWDAHLPCCKVAEKEKVKKVVFKINMIHRWHVSSDRV